MTKSDLVEVIATHLPSALTPSERQHLEFYPAKGLLKAILLALREPRPDSQQTRSLATLADKATVLVRMLRPSLGEYPQRKAVSELANTTHGVLDKLLEGFVGHAPISKSPVPPPPAMRTGVRPDRYPSPSSVRYAVDAYNRRFGGDDQRVWVAVPRVREVLIQGSYSEVLSDFVWQVRRWGRIQGPSSDERKPMATALLELDWSSLDFNGEAFMASDEEKALSYLRDLVDASLSKGVRKRHWSWASKVLHWIVPTKLPVYDLLVRKHLGLGSIEGPPAHSAIIRWEYEAARRLLPHRALVVGPAEPNALLRALDKYLWWTNGGEQSKTWDAPPLQ